MTREERIAEIAEWARAEDEAGCFFEHEYESVNYLITELRAADEELKKLRAATGVDMVYEQLALANRKLTEMTARHDAAVDRLSKFEAASCLATDEIALGFWGRTASRLSTKITVLTEKLQLAKEHVLSELIKKLEALK